MAEQMDFLDTLAKEQEEENKVLRERLEKKELIINEYFHKIKELQQEAGFGRLRLEGEVTQQQRKISKQASALGQLREENQLLKADLTIAQAELSFSRDREILKLRSALGRYKDLLSVYFVTDSMDELENDMRSLIAERENLVLQNDQLSHRLNVLEQSSTSQIKVGSLEPGQILEQCSASQIRVVSLEPGLEAHNLQIAPHTVGQAGSYLTNYADSPSNCSCMGSDNTAQKLKEEIAKILKQNKELRLKLATEKRSILELTNYQKQMQMVSEELKTLTTLTSLENEDSVDLIRRVIGVLKDKISENQKQLKQIHFLSRQSKLTLELLDAARRDLSLRTVQAKVKRRKKEITESECEDIVNRVLRENTT